MIAPANRHDESPAATNFLLRAPAVLRRHWKRSAVFFAVTMTLIIAGIFLVPKTYKSEAKLFVRMGRESVTLDPTATTGQVVSVYESRENEINSVLEVIQSRAILERVVDRIGPAAILDGRMPSESAEKPAVSDRKRELAIQQLERLVQVGHAKKSSVISVAAKGASPELAQKIAQCILEEFRELHLRVNRTAGSLEFFKQQKDLIEKQLADNTRDYEKVKNELGVTSLEDQRKTLQELIRTNQTALQANAAELAGIDATIASLRKSIAELPSTTVAQRTVGLPNSAADRARGQMNELQVRLTQLLTRYTENHPEVIAVREQIAAVEKIVKQKVTGDASATTAVNPTAQQLQVKLLTEAARAKSLQSKEAELKQQQTALLAQLKSLNANEGRLTQLDSEVKRLQIAFKTYSEKYEQARIDTALSTEHISNVNVVQAPTYVTKPVAPNKRLIGLLGLIVAGVGSIGIAYLSEFLEQRKEQSSDEQSIEMPLRQTSIPVVSR